MTSHRKKIEYICWKILGIFFNHQTEILWINNFATQDLQSLPKKARNRTVLQCCKVDTATRMHLKDCSPRNLP